MPALFAHAVQNLELQNAKLTMPADPPLPTQLPLFADSNVPLTTQTASPVMPSLAARAPIRYRPRMHPKIAAHATAIATLCAKHHVRRLDVFGSATGASFDPQHSDVDFLVEFAQLPPAQYFEHFFDLQEELAALLARPVDLLVERAVRNPHFLESLRRSREPLFTA